MRKVTVLLLFLFVAAAVFAQEKYSRLAKPFGAIERETIAKSSVRPVTPGPQKSAVTTYSVIDSITSVFDFWNGEGHHVAYDEDFDMIAIVHRCDNSPGGPAGPGEIYYTYSTDGGSSWTRVGALNLTDPLGTLARYSGGAIFNPTGALIDGYLYTAYPNLLDAADGGWGDAGYAGDYPILNNSAFCVRLEHTTDEWYGLGQGLPCWVSDSTMFISTQIRATNVPASAFYRGIRIFRTTGSFTEPSIDPVTFDTSHVRNVFGSFGGDAIVVGGQAKIAFGALASVYRYKVNEDSFDVNYTIAVTYSTDQGLSWFGAGGGSTPDTINWEQIPGLGVYRSPWMPTGSLFDPEGNIVLDSLGYPHVVIGLQAEASGEVGVDVVIGEIYKDAGGWRGKILGPATATTNFALGGSNAGQQVAYHPQLARNREGTFFTVQYTNSDHPNNNCDLFLTGRYWKALNWKAPINLTQTAERSEHPAHATRRIRRDSDSVFSHYGIWPLASDPSDPTLSPNRHYIMFGSTQLNLTPLNFDYQARQLISPIVGFVMSPDSSLTDIKASFKNNGEAAGSGSFKVKYRILNGVGTQVYVDSVSYPSGLGLDSVLTVTFAGSYNNPPVGTYTIETMVIFPLDQATSNDTLRGAIYVVEPAPITQSLVYKKHAPYQEITVTPNLYGGDDTSHSFALPFPFVFDGVSYDSATFSINGWVELGTADTTNPTLMLHRRETQARGTLNNEDVLTGEYNDDNSVNKVFAPWNDDLTGIAENSGAEDSGSVGYTTIGTAPARVLVIQWKNIGAWYEIGFRGTRINFQARLYESSNMIEFLYGPVVAGTYGSDGDSARLGASIGFKDTAGGGFHFFDVFKNSYGNASFLETRLSPLTDWPGPDSSYIFIPGTAAVAQVPLEARWNLVSTPLTRGSYTVTSIYPTALPSTTYGFSGSYVPSGTLDPGAGYWTKFPSTPLTQTVLGSPLTVTSIPVTSGWNLIGSVDHEVPAPSGGIVSGSIFGYSAGYFVASAMKPGKGYWVKTISAGAISLGPVIEPKIAPEDITAYSSVTITDKDGRRQTLFFRQNTEKGIDASLYEMPPLPPAGYFDARYKSGRILEAYPIDVKEEAEFPITLTNAEYPLTVSWEIKNANGRGFALGVVNEGKTSALHTMAEKGKVTIARGGMNSLLIKVGEGKLVPKEFALGQNYPNPFNPTTRFTVEVPRTAVVDVAVYDILGRKVTTLINGEQEAGYHMVEWNGLNASGQSVSSGMYFIRMSSDKFTALRKVMLMK